MVVAPRVAHNKHGILPFPEPPDAIGELPNIGIAIRTEPSTSSSPHQVNPGEPETAYKDQTPSEQLSTSRQLGKNHVR